jgi:ATP-dependent RNA helicase DeaD
MDHLHFIERVTRHRIPRKPLPTLAEALEGKQRIIAERLLEAVESGELNEYKGLAIQMLEQYDSVQLLSAALKLMTGEKREASIELTPEDPIRAKRRKPDVRSGGRKPSTYSGRSNGGYNSNRTSGGSGGSGSRGGYNRGKEGGGYNRDSASRNSADRKPRPSSSGETRRPARREDSSFE